MSYTAIASHSLYTGFKRSDESGNRIHRITEAYPISSPLVAGVVAGAAGYVIGHTTPITYELYKKYALYYVADECLDKAKIAIGLHRQLSEKGAPQKLTEDIIQKAATINVDAQLGSPAAEFKNSLVQKTDNLLLRVRELTNKDVFKKILTTLNIPDEKMHESGTNAIEAICEERVQSFTKSIQKEFKAYKDELLTAPNEKVQSIVKKASKNNQKNTALILGVSTLLLASVYSYFINRASHKK